ncbi:hypothetical protein GCM10009779_47820 [Polymorphospora rubra]|uniref:DUF4870 domain-containing protein n=1 Tax=Polymorphospora rubra TaxID=338584 RepID=A0A810MRF0_9ACTN|nr:DUF4870 domain-containing protein [Polymorphospora rubra]BCJ63797.1 hypothetical protein Prubr_08180 [Polymorphospora rubra]
MPGEAPSPGFPPPAGQQYGAPDLSKQNNPQYDQPASGGGAYPPPSSGAGGYPPPTSGAGGYPPPTSGAGGYPPPGQGYPPPGGGYPPQGGGYPPQGGYYGGGPAPAGYASNDDKTWALVAHFGGALGALISFGSLGFVGPLIAYLAKGQQSPAVRAHAVAALNFQILWSGIAFLLIFVSWCLLFIPSVIVFAIQLIFGILAGMKANEGQLYKYPMSPNWIK